MVGLSPRFTVSRIYRVSLLALLFVALGGWSWAMDGLAAPYERYRLAIWIALGIVALQALAILLLLKSLAVGRRDERAMRDLVAFQAVLTAMRGVGQEYAEDVLIQAFLAETVKHYALDSAWFGYCEGGALRPVLSAGRLDRRLDDFSLDLQSLAEPVDAAQAQGASALAEACARELGYASCMAFPMRTPGYADGHIVFSAAKPNALAPERGDRLGLLVRELASMLADKVHSRLVDEERLRVISAIEQASDGVWIADADGTIRYVNRAFEDASGCEREEWIGRDARALLGAQSDEMRAALDRGADWRGSWTLQRKDGALCEMDLALTPVRDASGRIVHSLAVSREIAQTPDALPDEAASLES